VPKTPRPDDAASRLCGAHEAYTCTGNRATVKRWIGWGWWVPVAPITNWSEVADSFGLWGGNRSKMDTVNLDSEVAVGTALHFS
jgi:hypothetical protein